MGIHRACVAAGVYHEIIGVDIVNQPRYPFQFRLANAMHYPLENFDFIWASPPCQAYSQSTAQFRAAKKFEYPDMVAGVRIRLESTRTPYTIENVVGAPLKPGSIRLCGLSFGLRVFRHRYFESSFCILGPAHQRHSRGAVIRGGIFSVFGKRGSGGTSGGNHGKRHRKGSISDWKKAMGIDWMSCAGLSQAVPPAYSEFIFK